MENKKDGILNKNPSFLVCFINLFNVLQSGFLVNSIAVLSARNSLLLEQKIKQK